MLTVGTFCSEVTILLSKVLKRSIFLRPQVAYRRKWSSSKTAKRRKMTMRYNKMMINRKVLNCFEFTLGGGGVWGWDTGRTSLGPNWNVSRISAWCHLDNKHFFGERSAEALFIQSSCNVDHRHFCNHSCRTGFNWKWKGPNWRA